MFHVKQFNLLEEFCKNRGISYNDFRDKQFKTFCDHLLEVNEHMNLTAVTDVREIEIKHFIDSLEAAALILDLSKKESKEDGKTGENPETNYKKGLKIVDVGTGAGFPGIPLAIVLQDFEFTLLDSLNKRVNFLKDAVQKTQINNVKPIQARAEEAGQSDLRESFDFCVSRAVADMAVLLEYCLPLVKKGGYLILYKSGTYKQETDQAGKALEVLGGEITDVREFVLPDTEMMRSLIIIRKTENTPAKYPRRPGKPAKSPIR